MVVPRTLSGYKAEVAFEVDLPEVLAAKQVSPNRPIDGDMEQSNIDGGQSSLVVIQPTCQDPDTLPF
eukprot:542920-Pyramimonas_sp.AAC.1